MRGRALVAQHREHAPQAVGGLPGGRLDVAKGVTQTVRGGLEPLGHGAAHGDGAEVPGHGVVQLAGDDEAVLDDGARGGLPRQAPLVGASVAPSQPQGSDRQQGHGEQHHHLDSGGGLRVHADEETPEHGERHETGDHAPQRGVARGNVECGHAASLGRRPGEVIEPRSEARGPTPREPLLSTADAHRVVPPVRLPHDQC